jgi:hypothetical protein
MYTTQCLLLTESVRTENPGGSQVQLQLHADVICYYCAGGHSKEPGSAGLGGRWRQRRGEAVLPARSPRHARQDSWQASYFYSSLSAFVLDQCVVWIRIGFNQCCGSVPYDFGPPGSGSGSISHRYRTYVSGSFSHQAKIVRKTLIPTVL